MRYVSLDIETGGLTADYSLLEVGAVIEDTVGRGDLGVISNLDDLPRFHGYLKPDPIVVHPLVAQMHERIWSVLNEVDGSIDSPTEVSDGGVIYPNWPAMRYAFKEWLRANDLHRRINIAGKNVWWDLQFLDDQVRPFTSYIGAKSRVIDPSILYARPEDDGLPDLTECMKRANLELTSLHSAVGDAIDIVRLLRNEGSLYA